jgi:hypothetical protein
MHRGAVHQTAKWVVRGSVLAIFGLLLVSARSALGVPAFARKYGTSCLTCHTIYPKLNPFGEAFRRNGYRFPGVDSDFVKQETVSLGQDAYKKEWPHAVWPGTLPGGVPIALGFNGEAVMHPDKNSGGAQADNGAGLNLNDLVAEGHVWAAGSFDDQITFFGELTFADGSTEIEHVSVHFNDLIGGPHEFNLVVGKIMPTLSTFGPHSSYLADMATTPLSVTALFGATSDSWNVADAYSGLEVNGTIDGRFDYAVGANAGANVETRSPGDFYAHLGYKFGGVRLDGEKGSSVPDAKKPWAEKAVTLHTFYYRSASRFSALDESIWDDTTTTFGGGVRAQWDSLEFDTGAYREEHDHAQFDGGRVTALAQYNELSYVVYPWLVPAVRVEYVKLSPSGGRTVTDLRAFAGVAALVRPNIKLTLVAQAEKASGAPSGGWEPAGGLAAPVSPTSSVAAEVEAITLGLAFAF